MGILDDFKLDGKTAVVTGASAGLGRYKGFPLCRFSPSRLRGGRKKFTIPSFPWRTQIQSDLWESGFPDFEA